MSSQGVSKSREEIMLEVGISHTGGVNAMVAMPEPKPVSVHVDSKGRITLPAKLREALSLEEGDTLFVRLRGDTLELVKAENPFDALARHALREHREGRIRDLREIARDWGVDLDGE